MDFSQPVSATFIIETILIIFAVVAVGIIAVRYAKKAKENDS